VKIWRLATIAGAIIGVVYVLSPLTVWFAVAAVALAKWAGRGLSGSERQWVHAILAFAIAVRLLALVGLFLQTNHAQVPFATFFGDEAFFKGLRAYYLAHASGNATTDDLRAALEKSSGKNLNDFFARWVYGSGHPRYALSWNAERGSATTFVVQLNQMQPEEAFFDPVTIEFMVNGAAKRITIYPKGKSTVSTIQLAAAPAAAKIDPDDTLLKEIAGIKP